MHVIANVAVMAAPTRFYYQNFLILLIGALLLLVGVRGWSGDSLVVKISNAKDWKQFTRTHTNVLVVSAKNAREVTSKTQEVLDQAAKQVKGEASVVFIDCSIDSKFCKKAKLTTDKYEIKHFKDGKFHKVYDRNLTPKSMVSFLRDPTGDIPWEEDSTAGDVVHLDNQNEFIKFMTKERRPTLIMLYAPWCGYCKRLKPDFAAAATELKKDAVLVGIDANKPENAFTKQIFNITGYPTLVYFEDGKFKYKYGGETNREGIVKWMKSPEAPKEPEKEAEWSDTVTEVRHLTDASFDTFISTHPSVLVMFYAPWCGHCKHMKPEFEKAAETLKEDKIEGVLAAVDATKETKLGTRFNVKGYPTVKYFKDGVESFGFNERTADKIVEFMKDPKEPPPPPPEDAAWEDTPSAVEHLTGDDFKQKTRKRKHALIMFYAPWCGHCKKAKPEYMNAAEKFKQDNKIMFGAIDCTKHSTLCTSYEVTGYPTFKYFSYGKNEQKYNGGREEKDFIKFMEDPEASLSGGGPAPGSSGPPGSDWSDLPGHEAVLFPTSQTFDNVIKNLPSALVMFYAPWCGHCKAMKPDFVQAALFIQNDPKIVGSLIAVDATVETSLGQKYQVRAYPTLKYFQNGEEKFEYDRERKAQDIIDFFKNPVAQPKPPAPTPWSEEDNSVSHLTSDTFTQHLTSHDTTLVMFYAPWCGHCKNAKPAYNQAALAIKQDKGLSLAAVDCTAHNSICQDAGVKGFPTLKFYRQATYHSDYNGDRTSQDFVERLKSVHAEASTKPRVEL